MVKVERRIDLNIVDYKRRRRQASENSDILINRVVQYINNNECLYPGKYSIKSETDLMQIITKIRNNVQEKARNIQPDWSVPIILEAIAKLYYGKQHQHACYGTTFKRALVYLWKANENNLACQKNLGCLEEVLHLSYVLEILYGFRRFFLVSEEFEIELDKGYCLYKEIFEPMIYEYGILNQGKGKRMRVSEVNTRLMLDKADKFLTALIQVLEGETPQNIKVFRNTFYEKIPDISDDGCRAFWQSVYFRYFFFMAALVDDFCSTGNETEWDTRVILFPEFAINAEEGLFTQDIVREVFWTKEWVDKQDDERYSNLIVQRPILRISLDGDYATCSVLIGDAINYYIESQIFEYSTRSFKSKLPKSVFKYAFSDVFEENTIDGLREMGFVAGHVTEDNTWKTQTGEIVLKAFSISLYGEIDVLAYMPCLNFAILVECKMLNDVRDYRTYKNIIAKLVEDNEGFQSKLLKKCKWVNEALSNYYCIEVEAVCVLLTDIPLQVLNFTNENILLTDAYRFFEGVNMVLEKFKLSQI